MKQIICWSSLRYFTSVSVAVAVEAAWGSSAKEPSAHKKEHAHKEHAHKPHPPHSHPGQHPAGFGAAAAAAHVSAGQLLAPAAPPALAPLSSAAALPPISVSCHIFLRLQPLLCSAQKAPPFTPIMFQKLP